MDTKRCECSHMTLNTIELHIIQQCVSLVNVFWLHYHECQKKRRSCCNQSGLLHRPGWKAEKLTREVKLKYKKVLLATCVFSCIKNMEVSCCSYRSKFENLAVTQQLWILFYCNAVLFFIICTKFAYDTLIPIHYLQYITYQKNRRNQFSVNSTPYHNKTFSASAQNHSYKPRRRNP